ncbi:MAG: diguanylate cyclase [Nitrospinae bacterium]|nr:diguanylate cyclase [Nitrospinota bacterium]
MSDIQSTIRVGIIGAGDGANSLLDVLADYTEVKIVGIACRTADRPAVAKAKRMGVVVFDDYRELAESKDIDLIIDASGNPDVEMFLANRKNSASDVLSGYSTLFLWRMVEEHKKRQEDMSRSMAEQEALYSTGVMLASAANTEQTLTLIMESALMLTNMAAGTLALYEEERGTMQIKVSMGFEGRASNVNLQWKVRAGGLTGRILSNEKPTVIEDLQADNTFDTDPLQKLGVRALIATPLKVEGKIVGILYVDDFKPRKFSEREINTLNLLATQAAAAIDKALLLEKAEIMAVTDELTKLYNHRYFMRALERETKRAVRYGFCLSLCMIDVDHFKNFNDTHGHLQGNVVLKTVAEILAGTARETDVVSRYGGEEFAIILSQANEDQAFYVAERIRQEVQNHPIVGGEKQPGGRLTVSVGVATFPTDSHDAMGIVECADKALYRSKAVGRNAVTAFRTVKNNPSVLDSKYKAKH